MTSPCPSTTSNFEFAFTDKDFSRLKDMVISRTGINISDEKRQLVYSRFAKRIRRLGLSSFSEYIDFLDSQNGEEERGEFINAITTNFTSFYREPHHFDFLRDYLSNGGNGSRKLRIWSLGCSSGEEPYTIAMTVLESLANPDAWDVRILATDIDTSVLQRAADGIYDADRIADIPAERKARWFVKGKGRYQGKVRVKPELSRLISFKQLNLLDDWPVRGPFDVIFFRNVIIYFDKDLQRKIFAKLMQLQRPGGILVIGHSENLSTVNNQYKLIGRTIYKRQ